MDIEKDIPVLHPGKFLLTEMKNHNLSVGQLTDRLCISENRLIGTLNGFRHISAEMALRLSRFFSNSPEYWMKLQSDYDLYKAKLKFSKNINHEITPLTSRTVNHEQRK